MPEIDPVILQLRADVGKYRADLDRVTKRVTDQLDAQGRSAIQLERQIKASSLSIGTSLKSIATGLAAGFSAREVATMADSYTRFTNALKVVGLEGENLAGTQEQLFTVAQRNGVELEAVGQLYSRAAQNQAELGASTTDLIDLTRAVTASLRISGTSANEASGALLQLGQALGSPRVQAEEFNSLLDTMQPLLREASKYIDGTGNSLSGLTRKIKDTKGEGVSNVELFNAITRAMADLEKQAGDTNLTISAAFTNLTNALTKYVGEADQANGASAAIVSALNLLAENLDVVTEALSVIILALGTRYVAAAGAATAATITNSAAMFALRARLAGAATSAEALSFAMGGIKGALPTLAIGALTAALYANYKAIEQNSKASDAYASIEAGATTVRQKAEEAAQRLATATGEARKSAEANAKAVRAEAQAYVQQAKEALTAATVKEILAKKDAAENRYYAGAGAGSAMAVGYTGENLGATPNARAKKAEANLEAARKAFSEAQAALAALDTPVGGSGGGGAAGGEGAGKSSTAKVYERDAVRAQRDIDRLQQEELEAKLDATTSAQERADIQRELLDLDRQQRIAEINSNKDLTEAQKDQAKAAIDRLYGTRDINGGEISVTPSLYGSAIDRDEQEQLAREAETRAQNQARYTEDALRAEASLATTRQASLDANLRILASLEEQEKAQLEAQIAAGEIADAAHARADLEKTQAARRTNVEIDHESPLARRRRQVRETAQNMGDAIENIELDAIDRLTDGLADASTEFIKLGGVAGDVLNSIIRDMVRLAAQQAIFGSGEGSSGGMIGSIGKMLGFSSGGYTGDGSRDQVAGIVHKGEYVIPADAVKRIGVQNLAAMTSAKAAASMTGISAASAAARPVQQHVTNYYGPGAKEFWSAVDTRAASVAGPIAARQSSQAASASFVQGQRSAPSTMNKYNQLKG